MPVYFVLYNFSVGAFKFYLVIPLSDSPRDSVQFIEWSPKSCPRALLIANIHGWITIWTQPTQVSISNEESFLVHHFLCQLVSVHI